MSAVETRATITNKRRSGSSVWQGDGASELQYIPAAMFQGVLGEQRGFNDARMCFHHRVYNDVKQDTGRRKIGSVVGVPLFYSEPSWCQNHSKTLYRGEWEQVELQLRLRSSKKLFEAQPILSISSFVCSALWTLVELISSSISLSGKSIFGLRHGKPMKKRTRYSVELIMKTMCRNNERCILHRSRSKKLFRKIGLDTCVSWSHKVVM